MFSFFLRYSKIMAFIAKTTHFPYLNSIGQGTKHGGEIPLPTRHKYWHLVLPSDYFLQVRLQATCVSGIMIGYKPKVRKGKRPKCSSYEIAF